MYPEQMGTLHRDLKAKPENVLVSEQGQAILSDFETSKGQASSAPSAVETITRVVVSGVYTAPEVLQPGGEHSRASDVYSFGVLLAQAWADNFTEPPATLLGRLGDAERSLLKLLLHPNPAQRPTIDQLLQHPLFREKPRVRACCICLEELPLSSGVQCGPGGHFTCGECLAQHVAAFSKADVRTLQKAEAKVLACARTRTCAPV